MSLEVGRQARLVHTITDDDTAAAVGSGDVDALATPRLLALFEAACVAALAEGGLASDRTSVGTRVSLEHLVATPVGETLTVTAELAHVDGRLLRFECVAKDDADRLVGRAEVTRVAVDRARFAQRLVERDPAQDGPHRVR
jgi:fluoroacetyl-CoA thioesterase